LLTSFDRNVPRKPRLVGGVKGHNENENSFPGSPALWAGSFTFNMGTNKDQLSHFPIGLIFQKLNQISPIYSREILALKRSAPLTSRPRGPILKLASNFFLGKAVN